ncbi:MAG TPA: CBS domain-containing protein [Firmicutes bacterium]|nr:CBS domain-containing protein [Bacillota bacterium]
MKAVEIMSTEVVTVSPKASLKEAIELISENNISGLPVVDEENRVIGIISETDIVNYSNSLHVIRLMDTAGWISPYADVSNFFTYKKGYELLTKTKVERVMSQKVVTVKANATENEIAMLMKKKKINRVPVVGEKGELLGIVSRADLINLLAEQKKEDKN